MSLVNVTITKRNKETVFAESSLDDVIAGQAHTVATNLTMSTLVDELADGLELGLAKQGN